MKTILRTLFIGTLLLLSITGCRGGIWFNDPLHSIFYPNDTAFESLYKEARISIAHISILSSTTSVPSHPFLPASEGGGIVVSSDRVAKNEFQTLILTNRHVIEKAKVIIVSLEGKSFTASVVGTDLFYDLALIAFRDSERFAPASLGDSDDVRIGQATFMIGHPNRMKYTISPGIIGNVITHYPKNYFRFSGTTVPGNSGGGLFDLKGELIGIPVMNDRVDNTGIVIPINLVKERLPLLKKGHVKARWIGVRVVDIVTYSAVRNEPFAGNVRITGGKRSLVVTTIFPDASALRAGILFHDTVTEIDGKAVENSNHFDYLLNQKDPGSYVVLTVTRHGKTIQIPVMVDELN